VAASPERLHRNVPAVEQLWTSPTRAYAVEHTRIETFAGQIEHNARVRRFLSPVRVALHGLVPGTFELGVFAAELKAARVVLPAHVEMCRLVLDAARTMAVRESRTLRSDTVPFALHLHRRHAAGSQVFLGSHIVGDREELRYQRVRRAFEDKGPKLRAWTTAGMTSLLVLEADDIQHSNCGVVWQAVKRVLAESDGAPDLIVLVETDGGPWYGWVLKDGQFTGDDVPTPNGEYCYTQRFFTV
jgi:hypothetical protein